MNLLTVKEISAILKVSEKTFRRYIIKYCLPSYAGKRFKLDEVLEKLKTERPNPAETYIKPKKNFRGQPKNNKYRELLGI